MIDSPRANMMVLFHKNDGFAFAKISEADLRLKL